MKIGLLALSGIRAYDPELLRLGLTLPGVLERGRVVASLPSLGLLYLAACTPSGHQVRYFETESDRSIPDELFTCDLVAINTFSAQALEAYAISDRLRAAGVRTALGGLHVSALPDEALAHADFVVIGEGENVWPILVRAVTRGTTQRLWNAADYPPVDARWLPVPRYDLLGSHAYQRFPVQTTRGCPWRCDFCASNVMLQQPYRKRPVAEVVRDIRAVLRLRKRPFIEFADDNTFVDKDWGKELCRQLIPLRVKWFTETDLSVADDTELLQLMRQARCRQVLIGLESPDATALDGIELKANFKRKRAGGALDAVRRIQAHGITVNGCFILGLDRHTPDIFEQVWEFAQQANLYDVQLTVLTPFPGTPLHDRLLAEGRILQPGRWDLCTLFDVNFQPRHMTVEELRQGLYWLTERLYTDDAQRQRRLPFFENLWKQHDEELTPEQFLAGI
ncbi:MAG: B12-binding domain-containing radical SAM protein [Planctomycetia bacterium]|nr:B12-binding domain-containing radical SAM protein [Planctomycetia bacterium]